MPILTVSAIHPNTCLRSYKALAKDRPAVGRAHLFINKACTMGRLVDSEGNVVFLTAPKGDEFDVALCTSLLNNGLGLMVKVESSTKAKATRLRKVA